MQRPILLFPLKRALDKEAFLKDIEISKLTSLKKFYQPQYNSEHFEVVFTAVLFSLVRKYCVIEVCTAEFFGVNLAL
ncbi:MAG: hypothetical protein WC222_01465 [Parachlamydiales bacterium]